MKKLEVSTLGEIGSAPSISTQLNEVAMTFSQEHGAPRTPEHVMRSKSFSSPGNSMENVSPFHQQVEKKVPNQSKALKLLGVTQKDINREKAVKMLGETHTDMPRVRMVYKGPKSPSQFMKTVEATLAKRGLDVRTDMSVLQSQLKFLDMIKSSFGFDLFLAHLKTEYAEENLLFFQDVEKFRNRPSEAQANSIYFRFIRLGAHQEINIAGEVREQVERAVFGYAKLPHGLKPAIFDLAQTEIIKLMERDSFTRFQTTRGYKDFLAKSLN